MNILVLSTGTRNKIIQYFKQALTDDKGNRTGRVIATDMSTMAPSIYEADAFHIVPRMTSEGYLDVIYDICKKEEVDAVLSLIDPELSLLAEHVDDFAELGVTVIGSPYDVCEMSLDKMDMFNFCIENGFNAARSWTDREEFYRCVEEGSATYPVFVKPQCGSASISINKVDNKETVDLLFDNAKEDEHLMIQEFLNGQEFGADCYIDMVSGELVSVFIKRKILMRSGETDKAESFQDDELLAIIKDFVKRAGYRGQIDIDIFNVGGTYYISEVNPRFGGGYPHAYECGVDHMTKIINNLKGETNEPKFNAYEPGKIMMKYNEVMVR